MSALAAYMDQIHVVIYKVAVDISVPTYRRLDVSDRAHVRNGDLAFALPRVLPISAATPKKVRRSVFMSLLWRTVLPVRKTMTGPVMA